MKIEKTVLAVWRTTGLSIFKNVLVSANFFTTPLIIQNLHLNINIFDSILLLVILEKKADLYFHIF